MDELKPCPKCGRRPIFGYACGEYFIAGQHEGCPVCDNFGEMHASREQESEAWNRWADMDEYIDRGRYCKPCKAEVNTDEMPL